MERRSLIFLAGWLCFVSAWLVASLAPGIIQSWNWQSLTLLSLNSLCWGIYGWRSAQAHEAPYEIRSFLLALGVLVPWLGFLIVLIAPYALGFRQF